MCSYHLNFYNLLGNFQVNERVDNCFLSGNSASSSASQSSLSMENKPV